VQNAPAKGAVVYLLSDRYGERIVALSALDADLPLQPLVPPAVVGGLSSPGGTGLDSGQRLHIADTGNSRVVSVSLDTLTWSVAAATTSGPPLAVALDEQDRLHVADGHTLVRVDDIDGSGHVELVSSSRNWRPIAVAVDPTGSLAIVEGVSGEVLLSDDEGSTWTGHPLPPGGAPPKPVSLSARAAHGFVLTDLANRRVLTLAPDGTMTSLFDSSAGLVAPIAACDDGPGITVVDVGVGWLRRYLPVDAAYVGADFVRGRALDGTVRFDHVGGLTIGAVQ
jgi:hypothetical protein